MYSVELAYAACIASGGDRSFTCPNENRNRVASVVTSTMNRFTVILIALVSVVGCGGAEFQANLFDDASNTPDAAPSAPSADATDTDHALALDAFSAAPDAATCPTHTDGFGDTFQSCAPVYSVELAYAACIASGGDRSSTCPNADTSPCVDRLSRFVEHPELGGGCREWVYQGPLAGEAYFFQDACGCPGVDAGVAMAWR